MTTAPSQPAAVHAFDAGRAAVVLTASAAVVGLAAWFLAPSLFPVEKAATAAAAGAIIAWASSVAAIFPVALLGPAGVMPTVYAYFIGAAGRVFICLLACVVAVKAAHLPAGPTAVAMLCVYLPLMLLETALVGAYLWEKDRPAATPHHNALPEVQP